MPLQMELGGKDVCIVCPDADLDLAATSIVKGGLSYQGQRCDAPPLVSVYLVQMRYMHAVILRCPAPGLSVPWDRKLIVIAVGCWRCLCWISRHCYDDYSATVLYAT